MAQDLSVERNEKPAKLGQLRDRPTIAVLIPCYNEELTISTVVTQFRHELPDALIYVFDNNSTDATAEKARQAGAAVFSERRQGKGYAIQSMFRRIDADVYIMVDGDETYPAELVHELMAPILNDEADMVVGSRFHAKSRGEFKRANRVGNKLVLFVLNAIFKVHLSDILSGYRAFNRRFVKGIPLFGGGFEIETELTIKAIERGYRIQEVPITISQRPAGSFSKINLVRDGAIILNTVLALFRDYQPLTFFSVVAILLVIAALIPSSIAVVALTGAGILPRVGLIALAVVLIFGGMFSFTIGLVLHTITRRSQEFEYQMQVLADELNNRTAEGR